jgi:hypothetical protein
MALCFPLRKDEMTDPDRQWTGLHPSPAPEHSWPGCSLRAARPEVRSVGRSVGR